MTTGDKILNLRKGKNITQEQLADGLGVSRQSVSKWESNIVYPEIDKLIKISELFNVSVDYLLKEDQESKQGIISKNRISNYNSATLIIVVIIIFGFTAGLLLSYQFKKMDIGFLIFIAFIFIGVIGYIIVRSKFYTESLYSNEDQEAIFKNTKMIYYTVIFTFITILPRFFITIPIEIKIPYFETLSIEGALSMPGFLIFAFIYSIIALIISWIVSIIHKNYVYKIKNNVPTTFFVINGIISIYFIGTAANILAKNNNSLIMTVSIISFVYLIVYPTIYAIMKLLPMKIFITYLVLSLIAILLGFIFQNTIILFIFAVALLIISIVFYLKAYRFKDKELILLFKNLIIVYIFVALNAFPIIYEGWILFSVVILIITALFIFGTDIAIKRLEKAVN